MIPFFTYLKAHCAILSYSSLVMLVVFNSGPRHRSLPAVFASPPCQQSSIAVLATGPRHWSLLAVLAIGPCQQSLLGVLNG